MKFRHKPVEVDAFVLTKAADARAPDWFIDAVREEHIMIDRKLVVDHVEVYGCTIYGKMQRIHVRVGDYIISLGKESGWYINHWSMKSIPSSLQMGKHPLLPLVSV